MRREGMDARDMAQGARGRSEGLLEFRVYAVSCGAWGGPGGWVWNLEGKMVSRPFDAACSVFTQAAKTAEVRAAHRDGSPYQRGGMPVAGRNERPRSSADALELLVGYGLHGTAEATPSGRGPLISSRGPVFEDKNLNHETRITRKGDPGP